MEKPTPRTKSIVLRLNQEEYARLEQAAQLGRRTVAVWCREVSLASTNERVSKAQLSSPAEVQALMAELLALRTILLNVLYKQINRESLTAEEMQRLIERADADKLKKAGERLGQCGKLNHS
jgi:hypothetical protein